jgi:hypothetical protein
VRGRITPAAGVNHSLLKYGSGKLPIVRYRRIFFRILSGVVTADVCPRAWHAGA